MDTGVVLILFFSAILIFGGLLFAFISRKSSHFDIEKYRCKWMGIEGRLDKNNPQSFVLCILQADSLLDKALKDKNVSGKTMGERMKKMSSKWSRENDLWTAHKIRNKIAHEPDSLKLDYIQTKKALAQFKQGLKDIGAI